eukprot:Pompholyxophrys_punicea_v1_NODE_103_length_3477_cov_5.215371.p9 type:complete len:106 gc:universal NODE_103_length_3477_cov_5.215371:1835-1518(-)
MSGVDVMGSQSQTAGDFLDPTSSVGQSRFPRISTEAVSSNPPPGIPAEAPPPPPPVYALLLVAETNRPTMLLAPPAPSTNSTADTMAFSSTTTPHLVHTVDPDAS